MKYSWSLLPKPYFKRKLRANSPNGLDAGSPKKTPGNLRYFKAMAPTMDSKILNPSVPPSSGSLERSGCGIIPSTFRPGLQIPAIFSRDPFGLASAVISPAGEQ